jgi:hypothetical protein
MRPIIALLAAASLVGCASLSSQPEIQSLPSIDLAKPQETILQTELEAVRDVGNAYLKAAKDIGEEDQWSGALTLGSAFYGAAVTAFNPAPKNLKAAILLGATGQTWRSSLKPAERARVYVLGYRAMSCLAQNGSVLKEARVNIGAVQDKLKDIRQAKVDIENARPGWDQRIKDEADPGKKADLKKAVGEVDARLKLLEPLEEALRVELTVDADAPYMLNRSRSLIETAVDRRLQALAPDYAGALKILQETSTPKPATQTTSVDKSRASLTLEAAAGKLDELLSRDTWPSMVAAEAYKRMGECVTQVG